jgi:hypothetical protein
MVIETSSYRALTGCHCSVLIAYGISQLEVFDLQIIFYGNCANMEIEAQTLIETSIYKPN